MGKLGVRTRARAAFEAIPRPLPGGGRLGYCSFWTKGPGVVDTSDVQEARFEYARQLSFLIASKGLTPADVVARTNESKSSVYRALNGERIQPIRVAMAIVELCDGKWATWVSFHKAMLAAHKSGDLVQRWSSTTAGPKLRPSGEAPEKTPMAQPVDSARSPYRTEVGYAPESDGLFEANRWTRQMPLLETSARVKWIDQSPSIPDRWTKAAELLPFSGVVGCMAEVGEVDWNEGDSPDTYELWVSRAPYVETQAQLQATRDDPTLIAEASLAAARADWREVVRLLPRCSVTVQQAVITADSLVLASLRAAKVHNYPLHWSLGINETMKGTSDLEHPESLFDLARRGLSEELGVGAADVLGLQVEWFGWCAQCVNFYVFSTAVVRLTAKALARRQQQARDAREHAQLTFVHTSDLKGIEDGSPSPDGLYPWLHHARLGARLLRQSDPVDAQ